MARRRRRRRGPSRGPEGADAYDAPIGPDPIIGPVPAVSPEELAALEELQRQRPGSATFSQRARPKRGRYFNKLSGRLKMAKRRAGRIGQAIELGTSLGSRAAFGRGLGLAGRRVGMLRGLAGLGGLGGLAYLGASPLINYLTEETDLLGPGGRTQEQARLAAGDVLRRQNDKFRGRQIASIMENARLQQSIQENLARVAQNNPALYNQVSAGRRLPRGAVVLGGQPRQDLLMELARAMDSGAFQQPDPLSELIG